MISVLYPDIREKAASIPRTSTILWIFVVSQPRDGLITDREGRTTEYQHGKATGGGLFAGASKWLRCKRECCLSADFI